MNKKKDLKNVFGEKYKSLDYIAAWYLKASYYIKGYNSEFSFVSTNSITQGEQDALLWERILNLNLEISFAHKTFVWKNNAKNKAAVFVVIVGVRNKSSKSKFLYFENQKQIVTNINPYLTSANSSFIYRRSKPISTVLNKIVYGNLINDGGNLVLNAQERENLLNESSKASKYIKSYIGSKEFLRGESRWCLYITDNVST